MDLNPASYRWSLHACRLGRSGSPRSGKRTDSLVKVENSHAVPVLASQLSGWSVRLEFARPWVQFPAGLRCGFSSDPAVSSSTIFVGAEREELIS